MTGGHYSYDPKAKRDRHFNLKHEDQTKSCFNAPLTSNQEYGWKQPIDTFPTNFGVKQQYDEKFVGVFKNKKK